jgi:energy-coupling factor transporter ATP-binding protein EcfA2
MALLELDRLTYRYPQAAAAALRSVDLRVDGGLTLVAGPTGGGKSTLLRLTNGLIPHLSGGWISGRARSCDLDVLVTPPRVLSRHAGFVFQDPELQSVRSRVDADIALALETSGMSRPAMRERVHEMLDLVGAAHLGGRRLATLSGGERQRVAIAAVAVTRPRLLVLDEPLSQLDSAGAAAVAAICASLRDQGVGILCAEHRLDELTDLADSALWIEDGRAETVALGSLPAATAARPPSPAADGPPVWTVDGVSLAPAGAATPVLEGLSARGRRGEVVAVAGPNGAGKTTLLRALAGFVRPLRGRIERAPGRAAYLPQNPGALLHRATVADEVELTLRRAGSDEPVARALDLLGISELARRAPQDLSAGERQRAAIAAILAGRPALALLDEPTRGMDDRARQALIDAVHALAVDGTAVVIATHDRRLVDAVADSVVELTAGTARQHDLAALLVAAR